MSTSPDRAEFTTCRTLGHAWDQVPVPTSERAPGGGAVWLWLRCTRCTTMRQDAVSPFSGSVEGRKYSYPDGYHRSRDEFLPRDDWRRAYLMLTGIVGKGTRRGKPTQTRKRTR